MADDKMNEADRSGAGSPPGEKVTGWIHWLFRVTQVGIALCAFLVVVLGIVYLVKLVPGLARPTSLEGFTTIFEDVLEALILLLVGLELALLLILRRPESLIEIMFFVVARKALIKTEHTYELLYAVAALAGLFAIRKYLMAGREGML